MSWLCMFRPCDWFHVANAHTRKGGMCGLYQCRRCKTISVGARR